MTEEIFTCSDLFKISRQGYEKQFLTRLHEEKTSLADFSTFLAPPFSWPAKRPVKAETEGATDVETWDLLSLQLHPTKNRPCSLPEAVFCTTEKLIDYSAFYK